MSYTLDDAHEAIALVLWCLDREPLRPRFEARLFAERAIDAIEADLPEPCDDCGSDQCTGASGLIPDWRSGQSTVTVAPYECTGEPETEDCPDCGSDQCELVRAWADGWGDEGRLVRDCRFVTIPITVTFEDDK